MSKEAPRIGAITWADLTVPNATEVREFYQLEKMWLMPGTKAG